MNAGDLLSALKRTIEQLAAFNEIAKALTSTLDVREVLALVMVEVSGLLKPSNWSLILQDDKTGELYFEIAVGVGADRLKGVRFKPGEGIAGTVFASGAAQLVQNVNRDPEFSRRFNRSDTFSASSALAVPLRSKGKILGVIELVNGENERPFTHDDLQAVMGLADYAAIAIENARNFQRVQDLTVTDEHTGLYNARHLRALLDQEVARAQRFHHPLSIIFLDLDGFKQVNDTHGHLVGSALLREVGELLVDSIRQVDFAFRYGGDEFAILLVETDVDGAMVIARKIRDRFREQRFLDRQGLGVTLTASFGVGTFPDHALSVNALLEAADRAMYRVKAQGKNQVLAASPLVKLVAKEG